MLLDYLQLDAYSCGVSAFAFFLHILGRKHNIVELRKELGPTLREGTSPKRIEKYLHKRRIKFISKENAAISELLPPCLVIYQYLDDGHYGVILSKTDTHVALFEPWMGRVHLYTLKHFHKQWYSKKYEKQWMLRCI